MTIDDLPVGTRARVTHAPCDQIVSVRLQEMGFTVGTEFCVLKVAPLGDPIEIDLRGYRLCIRKAETKGFEFEIVDAS